MYELITFVHIGAAVTLLSGSVVGSPAVRAAVPVRRAGTAQEMRAYLAIGRPLSVLEPVSALVVLVSGIYLTNVARFWGLGWVQVAAAFWLVNAVVAGVVLKPEMKRLAAQLTAAPDGPVSDQLNVLRWSKRWSFAGDLLLANDAAMLYLMTMKPDLTVSVRVVAAANAFMAAVRLWGPASASRRRHETCPSG